MAQEQTKPVKLQVNNSGAWKNVLRFDAADDAVAAQVMEAAATLGQIGRMTWRICVDDSLDLVLMTWTEAKGWTAWPKRRR
jgi:hypothetical protein